MPFELTCPECGEVWESEVNVEGTDLVTCPECFPGVTA